MLNLVLERQHLKWVVYLDESPWKMLHVGIVGQKLRVPNFVSLSEAESFFENLEKKGGMHFALKRLSLRNHSSAELHAKLKEKLVSELTISGIILECQKLGYLDDTQFTESLIRSMINKGKGPRLILYKLQSKGIPIEEAKRALVKFQQPENQQEAIFSHLKKRFKNLDLNKPENQKKAISSLIRKGFDFSEIRSVLAQEH